MEPIKFFEAVEFLEPKCPQCEKKIEYGVTTQWSDKEQTHVCKECGEVLK